MTKPISCLDCGGTFDGKKVVFKAKGLCTKCYWRKQKRLQRGTEVELLSEYDMRVPDLIKKSIGDEELFEEICRFQEALLKDKTNVDEADFTFNKNQIGLAFLSDVHIGSLGTDHRALDFVISRIMEVPNMYLISMAELVDNYNLLSPDPKADSVIPQRIEKRMAEYILKRLTKRVLGLCQGDHEEWSKRSDDFDITKWLAKECRAFNFEFGAVIDINVKKAPFKVLARHKYKYRSSFNPTHTCVRALEHICPDADVVVIGHEHEPAITEMIKAGRRKILIRPGTFKVYDRYARSIGYPSSPLGVPSVILSSDGRMMPFGEIVDAVEYLKYLNGGKK